MDPYSKFNPFEASPEKSPPHPHSPTRALGTPSWSPRLRSTSISGCVNYARLEGVLHEHAKLIREAHVKATEARQESLRLAEHLYHFAHAMQDANTSREKFENIVDEILDYTEVAIPHYPIHPKEEPRNPTPKGCPSQHKSPFRDSSPLS
ncbi:hypothetical protein CsatB_022820 [Cannabis sativa]